MANKNEAKIKFTAETGEFNKQIKQANDEMSELRAELKLNETQMKSTGATVEGLEKQHELLESQLKASQSKTEALSAKVEKAAAIFGENSTEVTKLKAQLANAQTAEEKVRQAIEKCNNELDEQKRAEAEAKSATAKLTSEIDAQQSELTRLKKAYSDSILQYGETSDEAQKLAREIEELSRELKQNKSALDKAADAADKLDKSLDDAGDAAEKSEDGFTVAKGAIADLASNAIQMAIGKVSEFIDYLKELPEATREIRQDFATLETSFERAGFSSETATNVWREMYKVFGEDDRAVEASNLIAKMCDNQEELSTWVDITKGVFGSYGDSLPVEGLAEAANETSKTGQVTGVLADALNWSSDAAKMFAGYMSEDVTTAEDAFNEALSKCTTEQERQALITETLTALYGDAATKYDEASGALTKEKEAAAESVLVQNELAEAVAPVTTAWQGLKNELLSGVTPAITAVTGFLSEHPVLLKMIAAVVGVLAVGFSGLAIAIGVYAAAQWLANTALGAMVSIAIPIIAAIAAIVAVVVLAIEYWDEIATAVKAACTAIVGAVQAAWGWICGILSTFADWVNTNVIQPVIGFFTGLWESVKVVWDGICNAVQVAIMFIGSIISAAFDIITLPFRFIWENCKQYVFAAWEWIKSTVTTAINAVNNVITTVWNAVKNAFVTAWNACKNVVMTAWNAIVNFITPIVNTIKNAITTAWNAVKNVTTTVFNAVKSVVTSAWNAVKGATTTVVNAVKTTVTNVFNSVKNTVSSVFNGIKNIATNVWNGIKDAITKPIEAAKNKVKSVIDAIKGFFSGLKLKLPRIKLPHFKIEGKLSLAPPSVPKLKIDWYKNGGILTKPTIFGMNGNRLMAGGEAGAEAILPIDRLQGYIAGAIEKSMNVVNLEALAASIEDLANRPVELNINGRQFATATAGDTDNVGGLRSRLKERGLIL